MSKVIVISGNIGSGKTTLREKLAAHFGLPHYSSDDIREELTGDRGGHSKQVFETMQARAEKDLKNGKSVILDSTGMSAKFRKLIDDLRAKHTVFVVQLKCDKKAWKERESGRSDRTTLDAQGKATTFVMPDRAFDESSKVDIKPNIIIDTTNLTPEIVFAQVFGALNM